MSAHDRFAALLDDEGAVATAPEEDRVLAELAAALRAVSTEVAPMRAEFRDELRASLVQAAREQRRDPALVTRIRDGARRLRYSTAALTGASTAAMALSGGGVALAAEHAQPDDALYDVKLALEDLRLRLTFDEVARGERAMTYAHERLEEARLAAAAGSDAAAATALRGAADRTAEGSEALLASGLVDPVIGLAGDLSAQVAALEALRPALGPEGAEAADALLAVIVAATEGVLEVIDASQWPGSGVPALPDLAVPQQTPVPTATPAPAVTTPPVDGPTPDAEATATATEREDGQPLVPDLELPEILPPDVLPPGGPLPGGPLPGVPVPQPSGPSPLPGSPLPGASDPVEDVSDGVGDVIDGVGDAVDGVGDAVDDVGDGVEQIIEDVIDVVPSPVQSALPDPVGGVVEELPDAVGDVVDVVPEVLEPVPEVIDGVGDVVDGLLPGLGGG